MGDHHNSPLTVIELRNIIKTYRMGDVDVHALAGVDFTVREGEFVAIMGASGSGKSTLMNLLGCLDSPTSGEYHFLGKRIDRMTWRELADIRSRQIGFVFQGFNLLSRTTALDNVLLPLIYDRTGRIKNQQQAALESLAMVGLSERYDHMPNQLSGGQQQRVAIARALINQPAIILADEPTGNLDSRTSIEVIGLFQELNRAGKTIILVTHEADIARYANRIVKIKDGLIIYDQPVASPSSAADDLLKLKDIHSETD